MIGIIATMVWDGNSNAATAHSWMWWTQMHHIAFGAVGPKCWSTIKLCQRVTRCFFDYCQVPCIDIDIDVYKLWSKAVALVGSTQLTSVSIIASIKVIIRESNNKNWYMIFVYIYIYLYIYGERHPNISVLACVTSPNKLTIVGLDISRLALDLTTLMYSTSSHAKDFAYAKRVPVSLSWFAGWKPPKRTCRYSCL